MHMCRWSTAVVGQHGNTLGKLFSDILPEAVNSLIDLWKSWDLNGKKVNKKEVPIWRADTVSDVMNAKWKDGLFSKMV